MCSKSFVLVALPFALSACDSGSDSDPAPAPEPLVANLGLAAHRLYGAGDLRLVAVSEADQGHDFDGDGDQTGVVLHLFDLASQALVNTGLAFPPQFQRDGLPPPQVGCNDALGVFAISEEETGIDLDQDGIPNEVTTWTFNRRTGALRNLALAHGPLVLGDDIAAFLTEDVGGRSLAVFDGRDGSLTTRALDPSSLFGARGEIVSFTRSEGGAFDLNADGDTSDAAVLHFYDAGARRVANTSFDAQPGTLGYSGDFLGFNVSEAAHGGLDLNGDGDAEDQVLVAVDGTNGLTRIPGLAGAEFLDVFGSSSAGFLLTLSEEDGDRNGDGDTFDRVAALYDPAADRLHETGLATGFALLSAERWIGVLVRESDQGPADLDGDGQFSSSVPHVHDTLTGQSTNLGFDGFWIGAFEDQFLAVTPTSSGAGFELVVWDASARRLRRPGVDARNVLGSADGRALLSLREQAEDLNGDGDTSDFVLALYDARRGTVRSLGLATSVFQGLLGPHGQALVLVSETAQGADLNGDGDLSDQVLHQIWIDGPQG